MNFLNQLVLNKFKMIRCTDELANQYKLKAYAKLNKESAYGREGHPYRY